jgi:hypothetical protein
MSDLSPRRPLLLTVGAICATVLSTLWIGFFAAALLGNGSGSLDGREVTPGVFFLRAGAMLLSLGVLGLALAFGIWRHRAWTRPLAIMLCAAVPIVLALPDTVSRRSLGSATFTGLAAAGLAALYFYGVPTVRAYYAQLAVGRRSRPAA